MQMFQSNLTLALLLVVFVSQIFPTCVAADIHHVDQSMSQTHHFENSLPTELQQDCCDNAVHACSHMVDVSEQDEHSDDFHTACHPPVELGTVAKSTGVEDRTLFAISYQNRSYAPPIPPPYR